MDEPKEVKVTQGADDHASALVPDEPQAKKQPPYRKAIIAVAAALTAVIIGASVLVYSLDAGALSPTADSSQSKSTLSSDSRSASAESDETESDETEDTASKTSDGSTEDDGAQHNASPGQTDNSGNSSTGSAASGAGSVDQSQPEAVVSEPSQSSTPHATPAPTEQATMISVSVMISSSKADGSVSYSGTLSLPEGSSVYDALLATGVSVSGSGSYINAINGLAEKQFGGTSGWMYAVNGSYPNQPASSFILANGASLLWDYVV